MQINQFCVNFVGSKSISMLYVSETASNKVRQIMTDQGYGADHFLRVTVNGGGCSGLSYKMDFDKEMKADDQEFEDKGIKLVTDLRSFLYISNTTLEFSDGLNGKGFEFKNPNATRTCACGESFAV
jgi:iron-sulfur cluster assembly protein